MSSNSFYLEIGMDELEIHLHTMPFAAVFFNGQGHIVEANAILLQATGHTYEEIKQKTYQDLFVTKDSFEAWLSYCDIMRERFLQTPRSLLRLKSGETCMCDLMIYRGNGEDAIHYIILPGIQEAQGPDAFPSIYQQIVREINLGIILLSKEARILEISNKACTILGVRKTEVINKTIEEAFPGMGEEQGFISSSLLSGVTVSDKPYSWNNGEQRFELIVDSDVFRDAAGQIKGGYYIFKNITNMRSLEEKIERSDRLAMIGQIAAGTAHEIRNPLTSINGFLQMMRESLEKAGMQKEKSYTDIMLMEIKRINDLVSEFLLLSKQKKIQYKLVDIKQVMCEILPIVKNEALLQGIEVRMEQEEYLPHIMGDGELLKQVFLNISKNGIEAMGGKGELTVRIVSNHGNLEITIHDSGQGIPPYLADKIFEPFFTTKENGTGLGLPVCQKIIHDMGGSIRVSSKGFGTTFHIILPSC
ncbi:ATP-binding protein [Aneurinibacillus uraniidurans]|uniref:ATP-binding protein n=1 Tax=Aneurinibacillus uraniidurans TaxID=2966586 RepID=UPI00234AEC77|nr:ATP-binding protein [Aneurinibacillus sp. B1]WCN37818.1 ATP-binding protein [Aneurinibacillus sp. B1]